MIRSVADEATEDLYNGRNTKAARQRLPQHLWRRAQRLMDQLQQAHVLGDLAQPPGNRLEKLEGRDNRYSVRINDQYRVVFSWAEGAAEGVWCGDDH